MEKGGDFNGACAHSFHTSLSELLGSPPRHAESLWRQRRGWGGEVGGGDKKRPLWLVNIPSQMWEGLMKPHLSPGRCPRSMVGVGMGHIL